MTDTSQNNKRIAKNTLLLYVRMLVMMLISLYTSRVNLNALGVVDYGIYNVVGGVVAMFSIISGSLSASISRFITYELGKGDNDRLRKIFSTSVNIQLGLSFLIVLLAETVGVWFLNVKMNIPDSRIIAANWVFQFSIFTFVVNLISVPYNALIIAHERMSAFAYISIFEVVGKLVVAFFIVVSPIDRLVFFALLICIIAFLIRLLYGNYCKRHFDECRYRFILDRSLLRQMSGFAGWNFIGAASVVLRDQGGNVVINLFCGPAVNAARGIAFQVNSAIQGFVTNFMTALNPQITKSYASGDREYMMSLIYQGARLSFYMLLVLSLPVLVNTHYILMLWLNVVPVHTVLFIQLVLLLAMSESISNPLVTAMLATGNIRNYQIVVGGLQMLNLPVSYVLLRIGMLPETIFIVAIVISQFCLVARIYMLRGMIGLSAKRYLFKVYYNVLSVLFLSAIIPFILSYYLPETFVNFIFICTISLLCSFTVIYYVGCNKQERNFVLSKISELRKNIRR